jgi:hypothetical protein
MAIFISEDSPKLSTPAAENFDQGALLAYCSAPVMLGSP